MAFWLLTNYIHSSLFLPVMFRPFCVTQAGAAVVANLQSPQTRWEYPGITGIPLNSD